jgi:transposase
MAIADRHGLPVAISIESATPHEVTLVQDTLDACIVDAQPEILIGDKAYDSDRLDERLAAERNIRMLAPPRDERRRTRDDGRRLRRYRRRWKVERLFAWLFNFRRLVTRYEVHQLNFLGFLMLACSVVLLRRL